MLEFLFPAQEAAAIANVPSTQVPVFDLSPFVEAGEIHSDQLATTEAKSIEAIAHEPEAEQKPEPPRKAAKKAGDGLWADLARLIEPNLTNEELSSLSESFNQEKSSASVEKSEPASSTPAESESKPLKLVAVSKSEVGTSATVKAEGVTVANHNPFPSFTLRSVEDPAPQLQSPAGTEVPAAIAISTSYSLETTTDRLPSPILYPARQPKKLASMAAVDLPSFPRK